MEPINYSAQIQNPMQSAVQGLQLGAGINELQMRQQAQEQAMLRAQQAQQHMSALMQNPNPTMQDYARVANFLDPKQAESLRANVEMMNKDQQANQLAFGGQVMSAFNAGKPEIGIDLLRQKAEGYKNSGQVDKAQAFDTWAKLAEINPTMAARSMGVMIAALPGGEKTLEGVTKLSADARAQEMQPLELEAKKWGIKNIQSEIGNRSAMLGLRKQEVEASVLEKLSNIQKNAADIPADTRKMINESAINAATSIQTANQFNDLAKRIDEQGGGYGKFSSASEWLKQAGGMQDGLTGMRQEYTRLRNTAAVKSLPPGAASDKDIAMAMSGFPPDNADAKQMATFLRGMGKLQEINGAVDNAKTDWLAQNNGQLARARGTFIAGDYSTKPGESFTDFSQRVVSDVSKRYRSPDKKVEESIADRVSRIPTKSENVSTPMNDVRLRADAILSGGR